MKKSNSLLVILLVLSQVLTACQPATQLPVPTASRTAAPPVTPIVKNTTTPGETVSFTTEAGLQLSGTLFGTSSDTAIVLAHESTSGESRWHPFASYLAEQGYIALTFSFRGFGESDGEINFSHVGTDLEAAIAFLRERSFKRIVCIGASLGGIACGNVSHEPDLVGLVIISSPFGSGDIELTSDDFADLTYPKLFIAGDMDFNSSIPVAVQQMYDWSPEPKQIKIFNSAEHGVSFFQSSYANELTILITEFIRNIP